MKVSFLKQQNPSIFLATFWKLSYNSGNLEFFKFEVRQIWAIFPMKNPPLYGSKSHFSSRNLAKIHKPGKENAASNTLPNG